MNFWHFQNFLEYSSCFLWLFVVKHGYSLLSGCFALHNLQIANLVELFIFCNYQLYHVIDSRSLSRAFFFTSPDHTAIFYRCNRRWPKWFWPMQGAQKIKLIAESTYQIITYYHFNGLDNECFSLRILAERTKYWSEVFSIVRVPFLFQQYPVNFHNRLGDNLQALLQYLTWEINLRSSRKSKWGQLIMNFTYGVQIFEMFKNLCLFHLEPHLERT